MLSDSKFDISKEKSKFSSRFNSNYTNKIFKTTAPNIEKIHLFDSEPFSKFKKSK